ncbi:MAG: hypothetical protein RLZZ274_456 [Cyanobacteriota bacterium]|jgi:hypothetical protein
MNYTEDRCERSEQHSHAKRVNESGQLKNSPVFRELRTTQDSSKIHKAIVEYQFQEVFQPHWFGNIQWQPFIADYTSAVKETRHFRNKFLCALLNTKPKKIPNPPERPRIIWFHEKAPVNINPQDSSNPRYKIAYHTHFHLEECPEPYDSWIHLDWLIHQKVAKGFHRFSTSNSVENKGFILKPWIREHHANYNLKDYYRFKHHQDSDLVLDIQNSDLEFSRN